MMEGNSLRKETTEKRNKERSYRAEGDEGNYLNMYQVQASSFCRSFLLSIPHLTHVKFPACMAREYDVVLDFSFCGGPMARMMWSLRRWRSPMSGDGVPTSPQVSG